MSDAIEFPWVCTSVQSHVLAIDDIALRLVTKCPILSSESPVILSEVEWTISARLGMFYVQIGKLYTAARVVSSDEDGTRACSTHTESIEAHIWLISGDIESWQQVDWTNEISSPTGAG